jgi:hypothetical protein
MMHASEKVRRLAAAGAVAAAFVLAASAPAFAQQTDMRWHAFLGCWQPVDSQSTAAAGSSTHLVCVVPADGGVSAAVDVVTLDNAQIVKKERLSPTDTRRPVSENGCTGWESSQWSPSGQRVYLRSQFTCERGLTRSSTGLLALSSEEEWVDVQAVNVSGVKAVRVVRYHPAPSTVDVPAEISAALSGTRAFGGARVIAAAPIGTADIIDATRNVDASVVEAWLVERGQGFGIDGAQLAQLAKAHVPGSVTDLMIALSYPDMFSVSRPTRTVSTATRTAPVARVNSPVYGGGGAYGGGGYAGGGYYGDPFYDPFYDDPFGYSRYNTYYNTRYGYSPYGYSNYYGLYQNYRPTIVVVRTGITIPSNGAGSPTTPARPRGQVVNGRGYTDNGRSTTTTPKPQTSTVSGSGSAAGTSSSSGSSSSGSSSSGSASSGSSSSGGGTVRTAVPRTTAPPPPPPG